MDSDIRVVVIATGDIAVPTLRVLLSTRGYQVVGVVTQPDRPVGRHQQLHLSAVKTLAIESSVPVFQPERIRASDAIAQIQTLRPEVIVVMAYGQILPHSVLAIPTLACLNLHASLLPKHRGAAPVQASILAGDTVTGMTVMYMDEGLDTGDILLRKELLITANETGGSLHDRLAELAPLALLDALLFLKTGNPPRIKQDAALANYAPKLNRESGRIDWGFSHDVIDRKIRAMNPWPGAFTTVWDLKRNAPRKLKIFEAAPVNTTTSQAFGEILKIDKDGILVACGEGAVLLREIQLEGRARVSAQAFCCGNQIAEGDKLGG